MGMMREMFLGLGLIRFLPMGMCMLAAYRFKRSICPSEVRFLTDSGLRALPVVALPVPDPFFSNKIEKAKSRTT